MKITFIGLGIMGRCMAANLLKGDLDLTVFNRSEAPMQQLAQLGASMAASSRKAVANADIVVTMLANPEAVDQVALSADGFVAAMQPHSLWIDCSTVNPSFSLYAAQVCRTHQVRFIDAPVAGSKPQAQDRELVFLAGGDAADLKAAEQVLLLMGSRVVHVGATGKGACLKMLVNSLLAQSMLAFSETVLLGEKLGLPRDFLLDTLPALPVSAPFIKAKADLIRTGSYDPLFPLELMHKDLHLAALTAYEANQPLPSANLAKEIYAAAKQHGLGRQDFSAIFKFLTDQ